MQQYDFSVHRGATFYKTLIFKRNGEPVDLTGYQAQSQVRECPDGGALLCNIECSIVPLAGRVELLIPATESARFTSGVYAWDIRLKSPTSITEYYLGGAFRVLPSVTE